MDPPSDAEQAVANAHAWFDHNSGWAPPDEGTVAEWERDDGARAPDECLVAFRRRSEHGLASWPLILEALDDDDAARHRR